MSQRGGWNPCATVTLAVLYMGLCPSGQAISVNSPQSSLQASVGDDVLLSVRFTCVGTPTVRWMFFSARGGQQVATWRPGFFRNVSEAYVGRLHLHENGSVTVLTVGVGDSGFYCLTVTDESDSSRDAAILLTVKEVLFEDVQYLAVFITILGSAAGFLAVMMWFLNKVSVRIKEWCHRRHLPEHEETELQAL
ncbi:V-set and transmembrane domain-containing protein 5 [Brienomyrus brachyistius]|uniref:V-set and transmembrane domain-containing protein 5 n=1 Tax=Brienomyrus brachyistius TaxID=42636 RepID=UPI0020B2EFDA|nr:V-set and transmembrane domain-containing protein 5 [Brienomyrus brachyistius]XP_048838214.1 V-set and transmembrane domain-containing protein 5 [Brienomyrus brachyistius]